jgi:hypothetical protein
MFATHANHFHNSFYFDDFHTVMPQRGWFGGGRYGLSSSLEPDTLLSSPKKTRSHSSRCGSATSGESERVLLISAVQRPTRINR